ncbi:hypothetical protein K2173_013670 [Erythroxylum novogranatense]|uniref:Protein kinase domain-containing protein n=1 Tax=Erythroxylum novogranatense TaxID=1862640 RepID=A0AAV8SAJ6_9ROSI|nr:hypothetical protein K2173_013670 [Erythroxylum novogranatense]
MGCISSKENKLHSPKERLSSRGNYDRRVAHVYSCSRGDEEVRVNSNKLENGDLKVMLIDKKEFGSCGLDDHIETDGIPGQDDKRTAGSCGIGVNSHSKLTVEKCDEGSLGHPSWGRVPKSGEAGQVAAGWPSWLASQASEAIRGWVPRQAATFKKLDRIGQGTYSNVYKAYDVTRDKTVALKKVRFDINDSESVKFMAREILILRRLDHPNIIKLEGLITSENSHSLYLVFEYMEHDLTGLASIPGIKFKEPQIKCYIQQLFSGLDHCHSRGVLHRDIKGSNLLIDNNGILKIADFGLASFFDPKSNTQLTSRVVTLWYRAPELLLGASHYGVAVDLWSTGCIIGELYTGKPILPGRTEVEQLHKIFKLCGSPSEDYWRRSKLPHMSVIKTQRSYRRCLAETFRDLPASAVGLIETLLSIDPAQRGTASFALRTEYFTIEPRACDPSTLPKYPPRREIDAKMQDDARRQGAVVGRTKESEAVIPSNAHPDLSTSVQRRDRHSSNGRGEILYSKKEQAVSGFLDYCSNQTQAFRDGKGHYLVQQHKNVSHSGPLISGTGWTNAGKNMDNLHQVPARTNLPKVSGLLTSRTSSPEEHRHYPGSSDQKLVKQASRFHNLLNEAGSMRKQDQNHQIRRMAYSPSGQMRKSYVRGPRGNKIYVSGPLLYPSNNGDQMPQERDRQIQKYARQQHDQTKLEMRNTHRKQET